jgi:hypothetical protein
MVTGQAALATQLAMVPKALLEEARTAIRSCMLMQGMKDLSESGIYRFALLGQYSQ